MIGGIPASVGQESSLTRIKWRACTYMAKVRSTVKIWAQTTLPELVHGPWWHMFTLRSLWSWFFHYCQHQHRRHQHQHQHQHQHHKHHLLHQHQHYIGWIYFTRPEFSLVRVGFILLDFNLFGLLFCALPEFCLVRVPLGLSCTSYNSPALKVKSHHKDTETQKLCITQPFGMLN